MYLRYHLDENGKRVYTFKFHDENNEPTLSAHPGKLTFYMLSFLQRDFLLMMFIKKSA